MRRTTRRTRKMTPRPQRSPDPRERRRWRLPAAVALAALGLLSFAPPAPLASRHAEALVGGSDGDWRFQSAFVALEPRRGAYRIAVHGARWTSADGRRVVDVDHASFVSGVLRGLDRPPEKISLAGGSTSFALALDRDGWRFTAADDADGFDGPTLVAFAASADEINFTEAFVSIRTAAGDEALALRIDSARLVSAADGDGAIFAFDGVGADGMGRLGVTARLDGRGRISAAELVLDEIRLAPFARLGGALAVLAIFEMPMGGVIDVEATGPSVGGRARFSLNGGPGSVETASTLGANVAVDGLEMAGVLDDQGRLDLTTMRVRPAVGGVVEVQGGLAPLPWVHDFALDFRAKGTELSAIAPRLFRRAEQAVWGAVPALARPGAVAATLRARRDSASDPWRGSGLLRLHVEREETAASLAKGVLSLGLVVTGATGMPMIDAIRPP